MRIEPFGDQAVRVRFGDQIAPHIQLSIQRLTLQVDRDPFPGFIEYVPAYTNVVFYYNPVEVIKRGKKERTAQQQVMDILSQLAEQACGNERQIQRRVIHIPVCYGGRLGPDLNAVAAFHQMSTDQVIKWHAQSEYLVYMLGFAPGFPFLGGMSEALATPRRATPRLKVAAGSVGIAGRQTGVYPLESPGGWQIIGRTPVSLFTPKADSPTLLHAGDVVIFDPIPEQEYAQMKGISS
ncbi:5-oxoprolinase subunit PxpB [Sporolactobacillus sp. CPB3-1]|uniref:5-oxoprolinase subunit PxpB n=1 Tax=Sporolactobacillus mangiferae TaxID=2940498 RepID=A0ABT0MA01_9BACL|nr:5-oxoprolinase subunit PxpB [Sporolactobacillus mangiferae]MCL1631408.1 5-oxoprolinase subunit PxpB [Sporolactobacillus mangiferae]